MQNIMNPTPATGAPARKKRTRLTLAAVCLALAALLFVPEPSAPATSGAGKRQFVWGQATNWAALQEEFVQARKSDPAALNLRIDALLAAGHRLADALEAQDVTPADPRFALLETNMFQLAPLVGACPAKAAEYVSFANRARRVVKQSAAAWEMNSYAARSTLYRLIFGGRMAVEEVLLQHPAGPAISPVCDPPEPSQTPSVEIRGVKLHSGDILISRGAAPTSALISRGNDYPGGYSHAALLLVDAQTGTPSIIEAHIERGVVVSTVEKYLHDPNDPKLRLMALRLRADLPALKADPLLPHKAAMAARAGALARHIPYDFEMNCADHSKQFCSEVVAAAYEQFGTRLWMGMTHISNPTVAAWLGSMGVRHFKTQEPADLEYDPQLRVVAEWHDTEPLRQAHIDDAVIDVMLEKAQLGAPLPYNWLKLPLARLAKAHSVVLNTFGKTGTVPEGLSATAGLRASGLRERHSELKQRLAKLVENYGKREGYFPPYWELVRLSEQAFH
jgi:hypothetical protein